MGLYLSAKGPGLGCDRLKWLQYVSTVYTHCAEIRNGDEQLVYYLWRFSPTGDSHNGRTLLLFYTSAL